jgi:hypothetical protein
VDLQKAVVRASSQWLRFSRSGKTLRIRDRNSFNSESLYGQIQHKIYRRGRYKVKTLDAGDGCRHIATRVGSAYRFAVLKHEIRKHINELLLPDIRMGNPRHVTRQGISCIFPWFLQNCLAIRSPLQSENHDFSRSRSPSSDCC